jgi:uncharacterized protein (TIGR03435 family)
MPMVASSIGLSEVLGRPLVDRTGLTGAFDLSLVHAPTDEELSTIYEIPTPIELPEELSSRPSIFAAFEAQLRLTLEPTRATVHALSVDYAQRPVTLP